MGIKHMVWITAILAMLTSCQWGVPHNNTKPAVTKDTLVYTYQTIDERAPDCGNKPDTTCSNAKITWPVFTAQNPINDTIAHQLLVINRIGEKPDNDLHSQAKNFIKAYMDDSLRKSNPGMVYTLESSATVIRQDSSLATIQIDRYLYAGGAHGSTYTGFINWNIKASKKISLEDLFAPGYETKLTAIAEKIFRKDEKLGDTSSLKNYFFKDQKFALNNNFLVTPVGIRFLYNEYEIKPYVDGTTELLIPYLQIKHLLRPNTVVSQYIK
jgi:hypothetical protein